MWISAPEIENRQSQIANWETGNLATRYRFTGREYDDFTGLHYYRARWYDGNLGRFISEDPIGFAGGDVNLYGNVGNGPLDGTDPSGKVVVPIIVGVVVVGGLILTSPEYVNAPGPGDRVYRPENPLILNAAGGAGCGYLLRRVGGPLVSRLLFGTGDEIIELGIAGGPRPPVRPPSVNGEFSIVDWEGYPEGIPKPEGPFRILEGEE